MMRVYQIDTYYRSVSFVRKVLDTPAVTTL
jgi:hypothetical protein